eukprot:CAMPEP_0115738360 /NCGR_PEP_ID=MMETSP0272-20121206/88342_1 /TAXON_ID=71861 /ORGANISM="Scrippsiella trochoidea, Strain CCMP3099" /LENGTH=86 /DNA_ID=CAMNT_0003182789 /DNA_START=11 /DNA_END=268 /DNA_ORIENTATION=+
MGRRTDRQRQGELRVPNAVEAEDCVERLHAAVSRPLRTDTAKANTADGAAALQLSPAADDPQRRWQQEVAAEQVCAKCAEALGQFG